MVRDARFDRLIDANFGVCNDKVRTQPQLNSRRPAQTPQTFYFSSSRGSARTSANFISERRVDGCGVLTQWAKQP